MRSRKVEFSEIAIDCQHPANQCKCPGVVFRIPLNGDGQELSMLGLHSPSYNRRGETGERSYELTVWRESIDYVGGESPEHTDREIQTVWHLEVHFVFVNQLPPASLIPLAQERVQRSQEVLQLSSRFPLRYWVKGRNTHRLR
jgi:hypothetical protein